MFTVALVHITPASWLDDSCRECLAAISLVNLTQKLSVLSELCSVSVLTVVTLSGDDNNGVQVYHWQLCGISRDLCMCSTWAISCRTTPSMSYGSAWLM